MNCIRGVIYGLALELFVVACVALACTAAHAEDRSHCGPNGFSPPAPWCDRPVRHVPEPGSLALFAIAGAAALIRRRVRA